MFVSPWPALIVETLGGHRKHPDLLAVGGRRVRGSLVQEDPLGLQPSLRVFGEDEAASRDGLAVGTCLFDLLDGQIPTLQLARAGPDHRPRSLVVFPRDA